MAAAGDRKYDIVCVGATGYTGRLTAEYITRYLPTDIKWAVAGRNHQKLLDLVRHLKSFEVDRPNPAVEVINFEDDASLAELAGKSRLSIAVAGPYAQCGSGVFKACAENGTHYVDCNGETPWLRDMIAKYDSTAKQTGSIMLPSSGIASTPAALLTHLLVHYTLTAHSLPTSSVLLSVRALRGQPSGGTVATILDLMSRYGVVELTAASATFALAPRKPSKRRTGAAPGALNAAGFARVRGLWGAGEGGPADEEAVLIKAKGEDHDKAVVERAWGIYAEAAESQAPGGTGQFASYGENFAFAMRAHVPSVGSALVQFWGYVAFILALLLPPVRWAVGKYWFAPGEGLDEKGREGNLVEYVAMAHADRTGEMEDAGKEKTTRGRMRFNGDVYWLTGLFLAEAAMIVLRERDTDAHRIGGGVLTPAFLGERFAERLKKAGVEIEVEDVE
ncbi:Saccharopine dehydrogenase-domain-containing protein [Lineolata rhizophorae]|uniref:Saccharopine dehydrogenase-domain-containing protein n=1 Tax=Lineolata rhizophorae TaxID=578093 RepID=A0A6A6P211_9PEZI|nr:Saccharopine dehydrogenase-domain-containing protein [Lineolata rhizophorae]